MDSTGFNSAAFFAGRYPKVIPTRTEKPNAINIEYKVRLVCTAVPNEITNESEIPKSTPIIPPVTLITTASVTN